jgi:hypothetical protein
MKRPGAAYLRHAGRSDDNGRGNLGLDWSEQPGTVSFWAEKRPTWAQRLLAWIEASRSLSSTHDAGIQNFIGGTFPEPHHTVGVRPKKSANSDRPGMEVIVYGKLIDRVPILGPSQIVKNGFSPGKWLPTFFQQPKLTHHARQELAILEVEGQEFLGDRV